MHLIFSIVWKSALIGASCKPSKRRIVGIAIPGRTAILCCPHPTSDRAAAGEQISKDVPSTDSNASCCEHALLQLEASRHIVHVDVSYRYLRSS